MVGFWGADKIRDDDIFIVSFPRSGNAWVRFLIANLIKPDGPITFSNIENYVGDIHQSLGAVEATGDPRFIKSHFASFPDYPRFVYIYRDGRDALVSLYHYDKERGRFDGEFSEFLRHKLSVRFGSWPEHIRGAFLEAEKRPKQVLLLKYENIREKPISLATKVAHFCGLEVTPTEIEQAVNRCTFDALREIENRHSCEFSFVPINDNARYFRSGQSEQWRSVFSPADLTFFMSTAEEAMRTSRYR